MKVKIQPEHPSQARGPMGRRRLGTGWSKVAFIQMCREHGLTDPIPEYKFRADRKWRFDWVWYGFRVALEVQGGLFVGGRHSRGPALLKEHEKLNEAAIDGWRVLFCTPQDVETGAIFPTIKRALGI